VFSGSPENHCIVRSRSSGRVSRVSAASVVAVLDELAEPKPSIVPSGCVATDILGERYSMVNIVVEQVVRSVLKGPLPVELLKADE
jgi:hypothetical protein